MTGTSFAVQSSLPAFHLWAKTERKRVPLMFDLELTARCNNDCRHCYINLPAGDRAAQARELSLDEISGIADQAVALGSLWCLLTGGEPLLRSDFAEIYMALKRKGLLLSVFTNACLVTEEHVELFRKYPPRDIEVSVYGATEETYERVTRRPGSYNAFRRGLDLLLTSGVKVRLKAMALRSNVHELAEIGRFCRERTRDYYRFDPLLHLRYDRNEARNEEIRSERLSAAEIVGIEQTDAERSQVLQRACDSLILPEAANVKHNYLFRCGAGTGAFSVSYDGLFRLCSSLWHPDTLYDLRKGTLTEAWYSFTPQVLLARSDSADYVGKCRNCTIANLCLWCPAHAYLETGRMDAWCSEFCNIAHARAEAIQQAVALSQDGSTEQGANAAE